MLQSDWTGPHFSQYYNTRKFWEKKTLLFSKKLIDLSFWTILNLDMPPNLTKGAQSKFKQV